MSDETRASIFILNCEGGSIFFSTWICLMARHTKEKNYAKNALIKKRVWINYALGKMNTFHQVPARKLSKKCFVEKMPHYYGEI